MIALGVLLALVGVVALLVVVLGRPQHADLRPRPDRRTAPGGSLDRVAAGSALLGRMQRALQRGDERAATSLSGSGEGARRFDQIAGNVRTLDLRDVRLRFVDTTSSPPGPGYREDAWVADVQVTWRLQGRDPGATTVDVPFVLGADRERATFLGVDLDPDYRVPLWLTGRVEAAGSARTLAIAATKAAAERLDRQARTAVATVGRTLPSWRGQVVVEAPSTQTGFEAASGLPADQARGIAGVTTTTQPTPAGSSRSPVHVYLNPRVFGPLGPRGQQIVVSHEATHVAVGAADTTVPLWLSEGFADYVALRFSPLPESVLGSQVIDLVGRDGAPDHLPGPAEFNGGNPDVGAWYEGAWIAVHLLGEQYGTERLIRFYRAAESDGVERAFRDVLGTTERRFERAWATHLTALAS